MNSLVPKAIESFWYDALLVTNTPAAPSPAFKAPVAFWRITRKVDPYFKNPAAGKNPLAVLASSGAPKVSASCFSELTVIISAIGPHLKYPAVPPMLVDTAGITFVASISFTSTPGDT